MPTPIDLYWSFRSPYSYLALKQILEIEKKRDVIIHPKIVLPLAVRQPDFFETRGPEWAIYLLKDVFRLAHMTDQTMAWPNPDPIVQDMATQKIADEQPYIWRLSRLGLIAAEQGKGLAFMSEASQIIWSEKNWHDGTALAEAAGRAGLTLSDMDTEASERAEALDAKLAQHDKELRAAGHWGVPTCVVNGEPFFGMDRLSVLEWRLDQMGVA